MNRKVFLSVFLSATLLQVNGQMPPANAPMTPYKKSLPMPDYISKAFDQGTRSLKGKPGKKYAQLRIYLRPKCKVDCVVF